MIRKYAGEIELVCDSCGVEGPSYDDDQFDRMISEAKGDGWSITRPEGTWQHECSDCGDTSSALQKAKAKFGIR